MRKKILLTLFPVICANTLKKLTAMVPSHYYKIIRYHDHNVGGDIVLCYWMPNEPGEKRSLLERRLISYPELAAINDRRIKFPIFWFQIVTYLVL